MLFWIAYFILFFPYILFAAQAKVSVGIDRLFQEEYSFLLFGKKIGLICNQTSLNSNLEPTLSVLNTYSLKYGYSVTALFVPEHGFHGLNYAGEHVKDKILKNAIPMFSLHGKTRRPTEEMLKKVNLLIYDIQDIGSRSYTYITTLFYVMEEAAKHGIPVLVLDRPNPINGTLIDGPMLEEKWRSFVGYVNVPYCHGMTVGELAKFFNEEYKVRCKLNVVPMRGWRRSMSFSDTGLVWIPPSPNIPEATTALFYPTTGLLGELGFVSIGIGYTLPFKVVGAPWIDAGAFCQKLNAQKFPGVHFLPFHYRPFYGKFANEDCQGVFIVITNPKVFQPVTTQYMVMGILKNLYPQQFKKMLERVKTGNTLFDKVNGGDGIYRIMAEIPHIVWPLKAYHAKERALFKEKRKKYLLY